VRLLRRSAKKLRSSETYTNRWPYESFLKDQFLLESIQAVTEDTATKLGIKPGQKLCRECRKLNIHSEAEEVQTLLEYPDTTNFVIPKETSKDEINKHIELLGYTPVKSVGERDKICYVRRKYNEICVVNKEILASALDMVPEQLTVDNEQNNCCQDSKDLQKLIRKIRNKLKDSPRNEKIKLLTFSPDSWTIEKSSEYFGVSKYLVKKARSIKMEKGINAGSSKYSRNKLPKGIEENILKFYQESDYSRICPGKKEFVSVKIDGVKKHMQKQLLLVNLKELYIQFLKTTDIKVGFSKFCQLRPKGCVTIGSASELHSVCVRQIHQNSKLLFLLNSWPN